ncbi:hypothetical protein RIF29_17805 [Crotalaria pallida]|uniref:Uncharacterized protein n=1 Tax=Crotalaria pallida TaxID=3830 RepID=A0AAN9FL50_CROPI
MSIAWGILLLNKTNIMRKLYFRFGKFVVHRNLLLPECITCVKMIMNVLLLLGYPASVKGNKLVEEIMNLVHEDWIVTQTEVSVRVSEFKERLSCLKSGKR